ncbi:membrane protein [Candidatus Magnetomorum sp. HK-1]|nr:membrane protein [Candidatus Magnetomorum sp. HK-1]
MKISKIRVFTCICFAALLFVMVSGYNKDLININLLIMNNFDSNNSLDAVKSLALERLNKDISEDISTLVTINLIFIIASSLFSTLSLLVNDYKVKKMKLSSVFIVLAFIAFFFHVLINNHIDSAMKNNHLAQLKVLSSTNIKSVELILDTELKKPIP